MKHESGRIMAVLEMAMAGLPSYELIQENKLLKQKVGSQKETIDRWLEGYSSNAEGISQ